MLRKSIIFLAISALLTSCSKKISHPSSCITPNNTQNTPIATQSALSEKKDTKNPDTIEKERSLFGAMQYSIPEGWEATTTNEGSLDISTDYISLINGDKEIEIVLLMRCPAGIGYDPVYEKAIEDYRLGTYTFTGGISKNGTHLELMETLFQNPEHGIMFVYYKNPNGVSDSDSDLANLLKSLEVNDCYGTVTIKADKINIRDLESTNGNIVGTIEKGSTYKVYSITRNNDYTWYNIGELEFIADNNDQWLTYTENNE